MGTIVYRAKRSLASGHFVDEEYVLEIGVIDEGTTRAVSVEKDMVKSLGGAIETLRHRNEATWTVTLEPKQGKDLELLREFLDSTDGGEVFSIDLYGQYAQGASVKRVDSQYVEMPFIRVGEFARDYFQVQIQIIEL